MNQPPKTARDSAGKMPPPPGLDGAPMPQWRRPRGVAQGTWDYVNEGSIAARYDSFVAETPLCRFDEMLLQETLPSIPSSPECLPPVVLDLGCGSGRAAIPLSERGYDVVGVDLSGSMLEVMMQKQAGRTGCVMPLRANLVQLDCLASDAADHAICLFSTLGMIQGRENRRQVLSESARILRAGGSILLHVHHRWAALRENRGVRSLSKSWWRSVREREWDFGDTIYSYRGLDQMFMHRFSKREILADLVATGWLIERLWPVSIDGSRLAGRTSIPGGFFVRATSPH